LIAGTLILAACANTATATASIPEGAIPRRTATAPMTVNDPSQPIVVKAGATFTITVESNPVSGLHWELADFLNTSIVDYAAKEFVAKTAAQGSPGWDVWTFKGIAPGRAVIKLGYYRGETEDTDKMFLFTVVVE
jgi:predicted secreted protein